jgi:glycosyltransferase involved in cell wall biosynthesis
MKDGQDILVSVCFITYNHEKYVAQALESAINQVANFRYEIVIGEDCSTDGTRAIVQRYAAQFPDLIVNLPRTKNLGARLNGIDIRQNCQGKYIALLEGDDYWTDPHKLQKQVDFLEANPDYVLCHHDAKIIDAQGNLIGDSKLADQHKRDFTAVEVVKDPYFVTGSVCFRNLLPEMPPEFRHVKNGDTFLFSILGLHGGAKYLGDEIEPGRFRRHAGGVWSSLARSERYLSSAGSCYWLSVYYQRIGQTDYADYYLARHYHQALKAYYLQRDIGKGATALWQSVRRLSWKRIVQRMGNWLQAPASKRK